MYSSRRIHRAKRRGVVAAVTLSLAGCGQIAAAYPGDAPPSAPSATLAVKSQELTSVPAKQSAPADSYSDIYIEVKDPRIVDGTSDAGLGTLIARSLREWLTIDAKRQHIADPTVLDQTAPKALHLTLEGEVGMVEIGQKYHHPCLLTMRLYAESVGGRPRQLVAQMLGEVSTPRELTQRDLPRPYSPVPLVAKMAPQVLDAATGAALDEMIKTLSKKPGTSNSPAASDPPDIAASPAAATHLPVKRQPPLEASILHLDAEPDGSTVVSGKDGGHATAISAEKDREVPPGYRYRVSLTPSYQGTVYLVSLDRETMQPTLIDSAFAAAPGVELQMPGRTTLLAPKNVAEPTEQVFYAFLQKQRDAAPNAAVTRPPVPVVDKKPKPVAAGGFVDNTVLTSASMPISDTLDPAIVRLVHLYTAHPQDWTMTHIAVTTTPIKMGEVPTPKKAE